MPHFANVFVTTNATALKIVVYILQQSVEFSKQTSKQYPSLDSVLPNGSQINLPKLVCLRYILPIIVV